MKKESLGKSKQVRYPGAEIHPLLKKARGEECNHEEINKLSPQEAQDELLKRFDKMLKSLTHLCSTGLYRRDSKSQTKFLSLFTKKDYEAMAYTIYKEVKVLGNEWLEDVAILSFRQAILESRTNLYITIVVKFRENIAASIKNSDQNKYIPLDQFKNSDLPDVSKEIDNLELRTTLSDLFKFGSDDDPESDIFSEEDYERIRQVMEGEKRALPKKLRKKLRDLLEGDLEDYLSKN